MIGLAVLFAGYATHTRALFIAYHITKALAISGGFK
jgi:hypothetical protein